MAKSQADVKPHRSSLPTEHVATLDKTTASADGEAAVDEEEEEVDSIDADLKEIEEDTKPKVVAVVTPGSNTKKKQVTTEMIVTAVRSAESNKLRNYLDGTKYSFSTGVVKSALDRLDEIKENRLPKSGVADINFLKAHYTQMEAEGRSARGKAAARVGETRTYAITNSNKGAVIPAKLNVPLPMYEQAKVDGAKAVVTYEKDRVIITFG